MGAGFDLHFASRRVVLSQRQLDILAHLSGFGRDLEESWDVPRGLSLMGIAEQIGVVRSALNPPLKSLLGEKLVFSRSAHVIGSPRRKKVFHVTEKGRMISEESEETKPIRGRAIGPIPDPIILHGREDLVAQLCQGFSDGGSFLVEGLPGIGKTSLSSSVCESLLKEGWTVRWATCNSDSDSSSLAAMWLGRRPPSSTDAIASRVDTKKTLLVLDEAQQVSSRHISSVKTLLEACSMTSCSVLVVTRAPNPFSGMSGFVLSRLEGLEPRLARPLLPEEMADEEALEICQAMDGHPLGIKLWSPEDELPGAGAVQEYVESTVIRRLSEGAIETLDELSLSPLPLSVEEILSPGGANELDESAILRWSGIEVEPHHLVRNVRNASLSKEEATEIHSRIARMWSSRQGTRARRMESHHRIESMVGIDSEWIAANIAAIASEDSSAAAVLLEQAILQIPDEELVEMAADLALERGEAGIAAGHIGSLSEGPNKDLRSARLARIEGEWKRAEEIESSAITKLTPEIRARAEIASLVRKYDDRLPGRVTEELAAEIKSGADSVDISKLQTEDSKLASLALDLLRHSIALEVGDLESASITRASLEERMGPDDPRIHSLDIRARLSAGTEGNALLEALEAAKSHIESSEDPLDRIRTLHLSLEASSDPPDWLIGMHSSFDLTSLRPDLASHRRAISHWWYWRGVIYAEDRLSSWKEAIARLRASECGKAARKLTEMLVKEL